MSDNLESGMVFKKEPGSFFNIEKSPTMRGIGQGVKTVEFAIRKRTGNNVKVFLIEAKKSSPRPPGSGGSQDTWEQYHNFLYQKMINSLLVYLGLKTDRRYAASSDLPNEMRADILSSVQIIPCLVLPDHPEYGLPPLQDELRKRLNPIVRSYCLEQPVVLNYEGARIAGLVESRMN